MCMLVESEGELLSHEEIRKSRPLGGLQKWRPIRPAEDLVRHREGTEDRGTQSADPRYPSFAEAN